MSAKGGVVPSLGAVILTMGDRAEQLGALLASIAGQRGPRIEVVVVGNGVRPPRLTGGVRTITLECNVGIPAGRNIGAAALATDVVLFLDDDGVLADDTIAERVRAAFACDPRLGIVSFRVCDPVSGSVQRRHVPRMRVGDPRRSSAVTTFLGGACAIRRTVLREVGGLPDAFFYAHEETDLAWRAIGAGWSIAYRGDLTLYHPATAPARHEHYHRMTARNRVWLARRNLPWALVPLYLGTWWTITMLRERSRAAVAAWLRGHHEGWKSPCGERRPMSWRTVWVLTCHGRPPIV